MSSFTHRFLFAFGNSGDQPSYVGREFSQVVFIINVSFQLR